MDGIAEQFEIGIKEYIMPILLDRIKVWNNELAGKGLSYKFIITGGEALSTLFPKKSILETHDVDVKLMHAVNTPGMNTEEAIAKIGLPFCADVSDKINNITNFGYLSKIATKNKVGLHIVVDKIFRPVRLHTHLMAVQYDYYNGEDMITTSVVDLYIASPENVSHYATFLGHDKILSEGHKSPYYIPDIVIDGVPYAALGYLMWDTMRMVEWSAKHGGPKLQRYLDKQRAILSALNDLPENLNCNTMKSYINKCLSEFTDCKNVNDEWLVQHMVQLGLINDTPAEKALILRNFSKTYLCKYIKRMAKILAS